MQVQEETEKGDRRYEESEQGTPYNFPYYQFTKGYFKVNYIKATKYNSCSDMNRFISDDCSI